MDVIQVLHRSAARHPERPFLCDRASTVTYQEADAISDAIAARFTTAGLVAGQPIGLCAPDSVALLLAIVGAWKAALLPALIDARTPDADLPHFVNDVGAPLIAAPVELHDRLRASGAKDVVDIASLASDPGDVTTAHRPESPLYLSYTSGTTGRSKGAVLLSGPVTQGTKCIADRLNLDHEDILLATTPASSSFQLVAAIMPAIHVAAAVVLSAGSSVDEIWNAIRQWRATVLVAYPLTLADFVNSPQADQGSNLRMALSGGSPLAPRIKRDYRDRLRVPLVESYGQSEFGGFMALGRPAGDARGPEGFVGRSLPDRPAYIAGANGEELPAGSVGEITVPHGFFAGYWRNADATATALSGGVLHCGDLGVADHDDRLRVLGRVGEAKAAERRSGFIRDLEDAYYEHQAVLHAAVVEGTDGGLEAFVELLPGHSTTPEVLQEFAAARVARTLRPAHTTILAQMPRTFSGKADRRRLARVHLR